MALQFNDLRSWYHVGMLFGSQAAFCNTCDHVQMIFKDKNPPKQCPKCGSKSGTDTEPLPEHPRLVG